MYLNFKEERRILKNESLTVLSRNLKKTGVFLPKSKVCIIKSLQATKGQIKPKADLSAVDSPKKRTNVFVFFALQSGNT